MRHKTQKANFSSALRLERSCMRGGGVFIQRGGGVVVGTSFGLPGGACLLIIAI